MPFLLKDLLTPLTRDQAKQVIFDAFTDLGFPVDAWQANGAARSFVEAMAQLAVGRSEGTATIAAMSFMRTAVGEFLAERVKSNYDESPLPAVRAELTLDLQNLGTAPIIIAAPGQVVVQASNGQTFANTTTWTLNAGASTSRPFRAEFAGAAANISDQTLTLVTPFAGLVVSFNGSYLVTGADTESDIALRERARGKWGTLRVTRIRDGVQNLVRTAVPAIRSVGIDDSNPRGPGTFDVYCAGSTTTSGSGDVAAAQAVLDVSFFGQTTGGSGKLGLAIAAPTQAVNLAATVYFTGVEATIRTAIEAAWIAFLADAPLGGYDFTPGPSHILLTAQILAIINGIDGVYSSQVTVPSGDGAAITGFSKPVPGTLNLNMVPVNV